MDSMLISEDISTANYRVKIPGNRVHAPIDGGQGIRVEVGEIQRITSQVQRIVIERGVATGEISVQQCGKGVRQHLSVNTFLLEVCLSKMANENN